MALSPNRRWYQFSLRSLLFFTALVGSGLGIYLAVIEPVQRQRRAVQRIEDLAGKIEYGVPQAPANWLAAKFSRWLPRAYFEPVISVSLRYSGATDDDLSLLRAFPDLEYVDLDGTEVTDVGVNHLRDLNKLQTLRLFATQTTNDGTRRFHKLHPDCEIFYR